MKKLFARGFSLIMVLALLLGITSMAMADDISNNLDNTVDATAEVMPLNVGGAIGTTVLYVVERNGDGKNGCNLTGQTTLVVTVSSSDSSVATVSPSSITFDSCGATRTLTVTPHNQGTATISLSQTSNNTAGTFDLVPATFNVDVAAPQNTAPKISILGVSGGKSYEIGSVPAASCSVVDVEDGNSTFAATISAISGPLAAFGLGEQTASCSYMDKGGLTASASVTYGIVDTTKPVIKLVSRTPANANGWNKGDVTVTWSCTDSGSGVLNSTVSQTLTKESADQSATGTCEDHAGNIASDTQSGIYIDKTAPTVTLTPDRSTDSNGWYNKSIGFTVSGDDALSGLDSCFTPVTYSGPDSATANISSTCVDKAGNTGTGSSNFKYDATGPTAQLSVANGTQGLHGWYTSDVTVSTSGVDTVSGPVTCTADQFQKDETKEAIFNGSCTNGAGLTTDADPLTVKLDKTAPTAELAVTEGKLGANGWYTSDVTVSTSGSDSISSPVICTDKQFQTTETKEAVFNGSCTNDAGLKTDAAPLTVKLDKTAPTDVGLSVTAGKLGSNGWYVSDVTVTTTGVDDISGVTCSDDQYQTTDTSSATFNGSCTNGAGMTTGADPLTLKRDATPPTLTWIGGPSNGGTYYFLFVPAAPTCNALDDLSGPDSCKVDGYSTAVGTQTLTATAYDLAGNKYVETRTYTVSAWTLKGFYQPVDMNGVLNVVKNGSTVPLKFEIFAGSMELTDTSYIKSLTYGLIACDAGAPTDEILTTATGGTALRYDLTGGQFIYNWKTPSTAGKCYRVTMTTLDGSSLSANFKLK